MTVRWLTSIAMAFSVSLASWAAASSAGAQQKSQKGDNAGNAKAAMPEKTGISIGEKAPPIKLKDQTGKDRSLEEWLHDGTVAVVFYRSAGW